jgi:hypothetical protein
MQLLHVNIRRIGNSQNRWLPRESLIGHPAPTKQKIAVIRGYANSLLLVVAIQIVVAGWIMGYRPHSKEI